MKASDAMTRRVARIQDGATLADAARLMWDESCGFLPVIESATGRLRGVITDRDVCMGAFTQGRRLHEIPVGVSMSLDVAVCGPQDDLHSVELVMREHRVRRLPVVDAHRRVVGVLSLDDIARVALEPDDTPEGHRLREDVARTLGLVSQPSPFQVLRDLTR